MRGKHVIHILVSLSLTVINIPWRCPSMTYEVFLCDNYDQLFLAIWSSAAYHDKTHGRTMIACDIRQLTVKAPDVRQRYRPVATHIQLLYALCMMCQAFSCSTCLQRPGSASPDPTSTSRTPGITCIEQYWQDKWLVELNHCGKTDSIDCS